MTTYTVFISRGTSKAAEDPSAKLRVCQKLVWLTWLCFLPSIHMVTLHHVLFLWLCCHPVVIVCFQRECLRRIFSLTLLHQLFDFQRENTRLPKTHQPNWKYVTNLCIIFCFIFPANQFQFIVSCFFAIISTPFFFMNMLPANPIFAIFYVDVSHCMFFIISPR